LRMEVKMSPDFSTVKPECDYALQPGDRLRVSRASSSALNQLFEVAGL
jgi:protein involved in polysaccharide export with SLBB domain